MDFKSTQTVFSDVYTERVKQEEKWGEQNHTVIEWMAILMEEVGEAAKEAVDYYNRYPVKNKTGIKTEPVNMEQLKRLSDYRKELIQVAAVAIQMIECIDRCEGRSIATIKELEHVKETL